MRFIAAFSVVMLMLHGIIYSQYTGQITINPADVSTEQTDGWDIVTIEGCNMENETGKPFLPVKSLKIAIPEDVDVTGIQILGVQQQELTGSYIIMPTQPGQIPGEPEPDFENPDPTIYNANAIYPSNYIFSTTDGFRSGVHIAGLLYYPLTYNPVTQKLYLTTQIQYQLVYTSSNHDPVKPRRMINNTFLELKENIKSNLENPTEIDALFQLEKIDIFNNIVFAPTEFPNFSGHPVEYVIITNENLKQGFQEIADWKTQKGVPAVVRTIEWIYNNYSGVDQAEKVRNFIIDSYEEWGTQFFMLGGDSDVVPIRCAWISPFISQIESAGAFVPADMYFACLDGNWNADGDATFGEANWNRSNDGTFIKESNDYINLDEVDRDPDVVIGRIPIEDYTNSQGEFVELNRF